MVLKLALSPLPETRCQTQVAAVSAPSRRVMFHFGCRVVSVIGVKGHATTSGPRVGKLVGHNAAHITHS